VNFEPPDFSVNPEKVQSLFTEILDGGIERDSVVATVRDFMKCLPPCGGLS
jgi:hypothetical protein